MDEGTIGILILLGISGVVGAVTHWFYRRFISACLFSAFVTTVFFQSVAFLHLGYLDPFFPIAVAVGAGISFVIALVVGAVVRHSGAVRHEHPWLLTSAPIINHHDTNE